MLAEGCSPTEETNWSQYDVLCGGVLKQQTLWLFPQEKNSYEYVAP